MEEKLDFYEVLGKKIFNSLSTRLNLNKLELEKMYLGIMVLILNISKIFIVAIVAVRTGLIKEVSILFIMFLFLRLTAAGIHASSNFMCTVVTLLWYIGGAYLCKTYSFSCWLIHPVMFLAITLLYKYCPADTKNRPILGVENRKKLRNKTMVTVSIIILLNLFIQDKIFLNLSALVIIIQTISVLPCVYKLFGKEYANYKEYEI